MTHLAAIQALWAAAASAPSAEAWRRSPQLDALVLLVPYITAADSCPATVTTTSLQAAQAALASMAKARGRMGFVGGLGIPVTAPARLLPLVSRTPVVLPTSFKASYCCPGAQQHSRAQVCLLCRMSSSCLPACPCTD